MSAFFAETPVMGHQEPRIQLLPPMGDGDSYALGDAALALLDRQKEISLDPWQRYVIREALRLGPDGRFRASKVGLVIGRQQGKSLAMAAMEAALLMLLPGITISHTAHRTTTAEKQFDEVWRILDAFPNPTKKKYRWRTNRKAPASIISGRREHKSGITFTTRTVNNARGLTADFVIFDEALVLDGKFLASFMPVMSSRSMKGRTQLWYVSSAGMDTSDTLRNIRNAAIEGGDKRMAYFEWSSPEESDLDDPEAWAYANPALGRRTSIESIEDERQAQAGSDADFARERMGIWDLPEDNSLIPSESWANLADTASRVAPAAPIVIGLDRTVDGTVVSLSLAGERPDGLLHVENVYQRKATSETNPSWVVEEIKAVMKARRVLSVVLDEKSTIAVLVPEMRKAGIPVYVTSTQDMISACQGFIDLIAIRGIRHVGDPATALSVASGRKRPIGTSGGWGWNRANPRADISPLVSMTLAAWGARTQAAPKKDSTPKPLPASAMANFPWQG